MAVTFTEEEPSGGAASGGVGYPVAKNSTLFHSMARMPWPYLIMMPAIYLILIGVGWTQDDFIEDKVSQIWIPTDGDYFKDQQYAERLGKNDLGATSFAAMAIARDGGNLFTESRLEEIRARMEKMEATTIEYKGVTYTWDDICALNNVGLGTAYKFPCARLSPMDLFQESRWFFEEVDKVTWHQDLIHDTLIKPRIPRFGIMQTSCQTECAIVMGLRMNETFAVEQGFSPAYANPLSLFADIGNLEMNDPCKKCIEENYVTTLAELQTYILNAVTVLSVELIRFNTTLVDGSSADLELVQDLVNKLETIGATTTKVEVEEFYFYYVTRGLYAQLGVSAYVAGYGRLGPLFGLCAAAGLTCPPANVTAEEAQAQLLAHADNVFSSVTSAGSPLPFWSQADGTGNLFGGNLPVGGSGVDMSQSLFSLITYLDLVNYGKTDGSWNPVYTSAGFADPVTPDANWVALVESNPVFSWFMAGQELADDNACGNGDLAGTNVMNEAIDTPTGDFAKSVLTQYWCTKYSLSTESDPGEQPYTKQHFARLWYDLLIDSPAFLGVTQGEDDPYTWTTGQGCGYELRGQRDPYTNQNDTTILSRASRELYYIDEGETLGVVDRNLIIGDVTPGIEDYNIDNPLQEVGVIQSLYPALLPRDIVERVKNCNRPGGSVNDITEEDAEKILKQYKQEFEESWTEGWDDPNDGDVQFVAFFDDSGVIGTTGRLLRDITLDNNKLTAITIILIMVFSAAFLFSSDLIKSKVMVTLVGVVLVILAFFAAVGMAILVGIKINVTIAWTLPFIMLGLGVDDVYIVLLALKKQRDCKEQNFLKAMKEVVVPVTMTSAVNCCCFAVLTASDIPAVYLTAQVATFSVIALYLAVIFCYPAYCYLDMRRQADGRYDIFFCKKRAPKAEDDIIDKDETDFRNALLFDKFYKPVILGEPRTRFISHSIIWLGAITIFACGIWGITEREVGLGLEDFFPESHQGKRWATVRTESLASWSVGMNWGALEYNVPDTQLKMIKQFEGVIETEHVAQLDTKFLWLADLAIWSTRQCDDNFNRDDPDVSECGSDQLYQPVDKNVTATNCKGAWVRNTYGLRQKTFADPRGACQPYEGGICRPTSQMFLEDLQEAPVEPSYDSVDDADTIWCPIMDWEPAKFQYCLQTWRNITNFSGGRFVFEKDRGSNNPQCTGEFYRDETPVMPIPYSGAPSMFTYELYSHELTLDMMEQTRAICDNDPELHCWMTGIPYDYWTQYQGIFTVLMELASYATAVGFAIAFAFLFFKLKFENRFPIKKVFFGSAVGALLIAVTMILSLVAVIGLSILSGVNLTGFSNMSFVLSVGFAVEYSVHVVSRWLRAPLTEKTALQRVDYTMSFLMLPTFMSFISSTIGVVCLAFTEFDFNKVFFFRPLIICMCVTYFYGVWWLPVLLSYLDWDFLKLGKSGTGVDASLYMTSSMTKALNEDLAELRADAGDLEDSEEAEAATESPQEEADSDKSPMEEEDTNKEESLA